MSHSVFRDLDEDKSSRIGSKSDVADNNLIVFIDKDDDVRVDPNALQDFIGMCSHISIDAEIFDSLRTLITSPETIINVRL